MLLILTAGIFVYINKTPSKSHKYGKYLKLK